MLVAISSLSVARLPPPSKAIRVCHLAESPESIRLLALLAVIGFKHSALSFLTFQYN